jgi:hypothetical protein
MKHIIITIFIGILVLGTSFISNTYAEAPELPIQDQSIENIVRHFALQEGVDEEIMLKMMDCESDGNQSAVGDGGRAKGVFQFHEETFNRMEKKMGEDLNKSSAFDQAKLASWAVANGMGNEWSSYRSIMNGGTYSFYSRLLGKSFTVHCKL